MSFGEVMRNMDWSYLLDLLISVIPAIICITVHEMSHGLAAKLMGDDTAETQRRLSLNPLRHIEPAGLVMLVVFKIGWAKPVPVNMMRFKKPKAGMAITALAGPVSNFILAAVLLFIRGTVTIPLSKFGWGLTVIELFDTTAYLSVCLGLFNLIPLPPMDGSKVLFSFLPDRLYMKLMRYERYGMIIIIIVMLTNIVDKPLNAVSYFCFDKLFGLAQVGFDIVVKLFL